ncbi:hypothetical protein TrRE_jg2903, partial [Triparma retinervis]
MLKFAEMIDSHLGENFCLSASHSSPSSTPSIPSVFTYSNFNSSNWPHFEEVLKDMKDYKCYIKLISKANSKKREITRVEDLTLEIEDKVGNLKKLRKENESRPKGGLRDKRKSEEHEQKSTLRCVRSDERSEEQTKMLEKEKAYAEAQIASQAYSDSRDKLREEKRMHSGFLRTTEELQKAKEAAASVILAYVKSMLQDATKLDATAPMGNPPELEALYGPAKVMFD